MPVKPTAEKVRELREVLGLVLPLAVPIAVSFWCAMEAQRDGNPLVAKAAVDRCIDGIVSLVLAADEKALFD